MPRTDRYRERVGGWALLLAVALLFVPLPAWASNFEGLWTVVYAMFLGIPYAVALLVLGIVGLVFVVKKQHRPGFGTFLLIGPPIITALYVFVPLSLVGGRVGRHATVHLFFSSPVIVLTIVALIFGLVLRKKR